MFWLFWQIVGLILGCLIAAAILATLFAIIGGFCLMVCSAFNALGEGLSLLVPAKAAPPRPEPYKRAGLYWDRRTRTLHIGAPPKRIRPDHSTTRERILRAPTMAYKFLTPQWTAKSR